jgi:hypothetical protein
VSGAQTVVTRGKQPGRGCITVMEGVAANICRRINVFSSVTTKRVHLAERTLEANDVVRCYGDGSLGRHRNNREQRSGQTNEEFEVVVGPSFPKYPRDEQATDPGSSLSFTFPINLLAHLA